MPKRMILSASRPSTTRMRRPAQLASVALLVALAGCAKKYEFVPETAALAAQLTVRAEYTEYADRALIEILETAVWDFPDECPSVQRNAKSERSTRAQWGVLASLGDKGLSSGASEFLGVFKTDRDLTERTVPIPTGGFLVIQTYSEVRGFLESTLCDVTVGFVPEAGRHYFARFRRGSGECALEITNSAEKPTVIVDPADCASLREHLQGLDGPTI